MFKNVFIANGKWPSSMIRCYQIAERLEGSIVLDASKNEQLDADTLDNVNLILCKVRVSDDVLRLANRVLVDVVDSEYGIYSMAMQHPKVEFITETSAGKRYLQARMKNEVHYIPEQHINFENIKTERSKDRNIVGYVGSIARLDIPVEELKESLEGIGLQFNPLFVEDCTLTREDIVNHIKDCDVIISFTYPHFTPNMPPEFKNPLKLINAMSLGKPVIAQWEAGYENELDNSWWQVRTLDELKCACKLIVGNDLEYNKLQTLGYEDAQRFDIANILKMWKAVLK